MKTRVLWFVCLLVACVFPLCAQQTLTLVDGTSILVNATAADTTKDNAVLINTLTPNQSWNTTLPANGNTLLQIKFTDQQNNALANTPLYISDVAQAQLIFNTTYSTYGILMTPATGNQSKQSVADANRFIGLKRPTKETCLLVLRVGEHKGKKTVVLANGVVLEARGKTELLPKAGEIGCLCGKGVAPAAGSDMQGFDITKRCDLAKKK